MLALFLNHPPMFVTGEIALCLSRTLLVGALIAAVVRGASGIAQLREAGHPDTTIVRRSLAEPATLVRMFHASLRQRRRWFDPGRDPRCARKRQLLRRHDPDAPSDQSRKFPTEPSTARGSELRRLIRTRRKSMERPPSRPGGPFALMREVGTTPASLAP